MSQAETPVLEEEWRVFFSFFWLLPALQGHKTFMRITAKFMCGNMAPLLQKVMSERAPTLLQLQEKKQKEIQTARLLVSFVSVATLVPRRAASQHTRADTQTHSSWTIAPPRPPPLLCILIGAAQQKDFQILFSLRSV